MIVKVMFEPADFNESGQMIIRNSSKAVAKGLSFSATVSYKIGYLTTPNKPEVLMISLADGMAIAFESEEELCRHLNSDEFGYRPMTNEEIRLIMESQGNRFKV